MVAPSSQLKLESWLVAAGRLAGPGQPLNVPIIPASNFLHGGDRVYSRNDGTPAWEALEEVVGGLESGRAVAFASGMAAAAALFDQLQPGAVVVLADDCYQGVASLAMVGPPRGAGLCGGWRWTIPSAGSAPAPARTWSGWNPRRTRCWKWRSSTPSAGRRASRAASWWWTTPSPRP